MSVDDAEAATLAGAQVERVAEHHREGAPTNGAVPRFRSRRWSGPICCCPAGAGCEAPRKGHIGTEPITSHLTRPLLTVPLAEMDGRPHGAHHDGGDEVARDGRRGRDAEEQDQNRRNPRAAARSRHADEKADHGTAQNDVRINVHDFARFVIQDSACARRRPHSLLPSRRYREVPHKTGRDGCMGRNRSTGECPCRAGNASQGEVCASGCPSAPHRLSSDPCCGAGNARAGGSATSSEGASPISPNARRCGAFVTGVALAGGADYDAPRRTSN